MRKFLWAPIIVLFAFPAFAADVVNGVDRSSAAYRTAYLNTVNPGVCDGNRYQFDGYRAGAKVPVTPLWASDKVQTQACFDASGAGNNSGIRRGSDGSLGGS